MKMKNIRQLAALLAIGGVMMACSDHRATVGADDTDSIAAEQTLSLEQTIGCYLTDSIAPRYLTGEVTIPVVTVTGVDSTDVADVKAWGDYWVFNYNVSGDTLKTVSGGSHPGLFHLRKDGSKLVVTAFDGVEDGSRYLPSAQRIFGDRLDAFTAINGNEVKREQLRAEAIARYVQANGLSVTMYQDYGWPARTIAAEPSPAK